MRKYFLHVGIPSRLPSKKFDFEIVGFFASATTLNISPSIANVGHRHHISNESANVLDELHYTVTVHH
jgi:hypothetical protein